MSGPDRINGNVIRRSSQCGAELQVDLWLRETLASSYDRVLAEPLPEAWIALIGAGGARDGSA